MGFFSDIIDRRKLPSIQDTIDQAQSKPGLDVQGVIDQNQVAAPQSVKPKFGGATLSQGTTDPAEEDRRKVGGAIGTFVFGTGSQGPSERLYPEGSLRQLIVENGIAGFLFEGFQRQQNPTRAELAERIDTRFSKLVEKGESPDRALDVAIEDTLKNTPGSATNIQDLQKPGVKLSKEEKDILFVTNALEDTFSVLDAPVFVGSTKLTTEGAERLAKQTEEIRDLILDRSATQPVIRDQRVDILDEDEKVEAYIENLKANPQPSISFLQDGVAVLEKSGRDAGDIKKMLNQTVEEVKTEPGKFLRDPKTGKFQGSTPSLTPFTNEGNLTTTILNELEGKTSVSKQFITDLTNTTGRKKAENDIIREVLEEYPDGSKIPAQEFAEKVQSKLLPLERNVAGFDQYGKYENISLPGDVRGDVAKYEERVYQSPIKNSAGDVHFVDEGIEDYFAHTRIEDMADNSTRRVIEVQSDLFQKGRLESELRTGLVGEKVKLKSGEEVKITGSGIEKYGGSGMSSDIRNYKTEDGRKILLDDIESPFVPLQPYRNTWWERIIREEVKTAAADGKTKLQFPTGQTAMKIEGLGQQSNWTLQTASGSKLEIDDLKAGKQIHNGAQEYMVTDVLDNGQFKAVPRARVEQEASMRGVSTMQALKDLKRINSSSIEQFDISGKVDTNNPIYKFYEKDVQKYLSKNYGAKVVTDAQGVKWVELDVNPAMADKPVEAFAGVIAGIEENEDGDIEVDPAKSFLGIAAAGFLGKGFIKGRNQTRNVGAQGDTPGRLPQRTSPQKTQVPKVGQTEYPLSSEKAVASLTKAYNESSDLSLDAVDKTLPLFDPKPENIALYSRFREGMNNAWVKLVEFVQDDMKRVRDLVNDPNVKVADDTDPYLAEVLFHGRVGARLEEARDTVIKIDSDIVATAKQWGIPDQDMTLMVNKYLHARHAPERNAKLGNGAAGLTDNEANQIMGQIDALPYSAEVKRIADDIQTMNNQTLEVLREAQVIDQELYDTLRATYKNHVPLQRVLDDQDDIIEAMTGRGFDVRSTGVKRAKGSDRQVSDILANVVTNYEQAIIRAEKNRVDLTTLQFARDNADLGLFKEVKPQAIGRMFSGSEGRPTRDILEKSEDFQQTVNFVEEELGRAEYEVVTEMTELSKAGRRFTDESGNLHVEQSTFPKWVPEEYRESKLFRKVVDHLEKGTLPPDNATRQQALLKEVKDEIARRVDPSVLDEQALQSIAQKKTFRASVAKTLADRAEGPLIYEKIRDPRVLELRENGKPVYLKIADENIALALKGVARHQVPPMMKFIQAFTRFYSGLQTRFNPEFAFPNKIRDIQEAVVFAGSRKEVGFRGGIKAAMNQKAYKDVLDHLRGNNTDGAKLYKQMIEDGGTTGGMSLSTKEAVELDIKQIRKLNRSNPRQAADKLIRTIDNFNQIVEDSTRLSIYKEALDRGVSRKRAAELAKESTVNFNKFGRGGPIINSLWMFSNASIQGTTKMLRAMKNPKVAATVSTAVAGAVYATSEWNDNVDPDWRKKIPEWDRLNTLPVVLPSEDDSFNYIAIPVGWGIKPLKVMADYAFDASYGEDVELIDALNGIGGATINAYNPLGGTDVFSSVMPTILDIPSELARNKAWHGGKIKPDWDQNAPESIKYFSSLEDTSTGETTIAISKGLSGMGIEVSPADIYYAYQGYIGGAGRTATDAVNTIAAATRWEMPQAKDVPVAGRFYKVRDNEEIGAASKEHEDIKKLLEEQSRERFYLKQDAEDAYMQMKALPPEEAAARFDVIAAQDPDLAAKIADVKKEDDLGLTYTQRLIKQLGVANGERAEYIYKKMQELDSDEMRADLWDEYTEKKIISNTVAEQLMELMKQ